MHHRDAACNVIIKYPPLNECSVNKMLGAFGEMKSTCCMQEIELLVRLQLAPHTTVFTLFGVNNLIMAYKTGIGDSYCYYSKRNS